MQDKVTETGVMIHYVIVEVDRGEKLVEEAIPLSHPADDSIESLEEKIHKLEHRLIVQGTEKALAEFREGKY
jgi:phosphoribosylglycinamide formyltransferase